MDSSEHEQEETSDPGGHIKDQGSLFLCFLLYSEMARRATLTHNNADCSSDTLETIYPPGLLSHRLNQIQTELCWPTVTAIMSQFGQHEQILLNQIAGWGSQHNIWLCWQWFKAMRLSSATYLSLCDLQQGHLCWRSTVWLAGWERKPKRHARTLQLRY